MNPQLCFRYESDVIYHVSVAEPTDLAVHVQADPRLAYSLGLRSACADAATQFSCRNTPVVSLTEIRPRAA